MSEPADVTIAVFSARIVSIPAWIAAALLLPGMSGWLRTQSRTLLADSTLLMICVFAFTTVVSESLKNAAATATRSFTDSMSTIRLSSEVWAAFAPLPDQVPTPANN
jgi:hypothetical protein